MSLDKTNNLEHCYGIHTYLSEEIMPKIYEVRQRTLSGSSYYEHTQDLVVAFVRSGEGLLDLNGKTFPVARGGYAYFVFCDHYRFTAAKNSSLVIDFLSANINLALYTWSVTYKKLPDTNFLNHEATLVHLDEKDCARVTQVFDKMYLTSKILSAERDTLLFYLYNEISGRYLRARLTRQA